MNLKEDSISRRKSKQRTIGKVTIHFIITQRGLGKGGVR